jgi:hypothetical protein
MKINQVKPMPDIIRIVESNGIMILSGDSSRSLFLPYPDAAIWHIVLKYGVNRKSVDILSAVCNATAQKTEKRIERAICKWTELGLIISS